MSPIIKRVGIGVIQSDFDFGFATGTLKSMAVIALAVCRDPYKAHYGLAVTADRSLHELVRKANCFKGHDASR